MADSFLGSQGGGSGRGDFGVLPPTALPGGLPRAFLPVLGAASSEPIGPLTAAPFAPDQPIGPDLLDYASLVQPLAELLGHAATPMPLTAALFGGPGVGKSFALGRLVEALRIRANAAREGGPVLAPLFIAQMDAADLCGDPQGALGSALCAALVQSGNPAFAEIAHHAVETASDPHDAVEVARDKLAASRLALDNESRNLAEMRARSARLVESLLNDPAGTPLDVYLRANRSSIEARLRGFGFQRGDAAANFRDLVRDLHESGGALPGISAFLHAMWAFRGQTRLIVWATFWAALGVGINVLQATKTVWLAWLNSLGPNFNAPAAWIALHESWLGPAALAAFGLAGLCLVWNLLRAWRFTRPLVEGMSLLRADLATKRSALDTLISQQSRRVDALTQDIQRQERVAASAEQRAAASGERASQKPGDLMGRVLPPASPAQDFVGNLLGLLQTAPAGAPRRMIVTIDNLDGVMPARAAEIMEAAARLFSGPLFGTVLALDPQHVAKAWGESPARLDRLVQVPLQIGRNGLSQAQSSALVLSMLGHNRPSGRPSPPQADANQSMLDRPMTVTEAKLLTELAPLAGRSARSVKRLVNLFRLARAPVAASAPAAAFLLALDIGGTPAEITALRNGLNSTPGTGEFKLAEASPRLNAALQALRVADGGPLTGVVMMAGLAAASPYMRR